MPQEPSRGVVALFALLLAGSASFEVRAQTEPDAPPVEESSEASVPEVVVPPALGRDGSFDARSLLDDPGFSQWFSGVIRVERAGEVLLEVAQGYDASGEGFTQDSIFWLGSISKMLCATMILQLEEEGRLSLQDPVGDHLPGWTAGDLTRNGEVCTIERMLSHQCGLPRDVPIQRYGELLDPIRRQEARVKYLEATRAMTLEFTPGTDYRYSNIGYNLAGLIVLNHGQSTYDEALQRRLFRPLGLETTGSEPARIQGFFERVAPLAINLGHMGLNGSTWLGLPEDAPSRVGSSGHGFSTARELTAFFRTLVSGDLLETAARQSLITPRSGKKAEAKNYGLGILVSKNEAFTEIWHNGALSPHGFSAHVAHIPEWDLTLTVLSNRDLSIYKASDVAGGLLNLLKKAPYKSPFPEGVGGWLGVNFNGLIYLLVIPWLFITLVLAGFRTPKGSRVSWGLGMATTAWAVLFFRGLLRIHSGDGGAIVLSTVLFALLAWVLWRGLSRHPDMPLWPEKTPGLGRARSWAGILLGTLAMVGSALLIPLFATQTAAMLALATAAILYGPGGPGSRSQSA